MYLPTPKKCEIKEDGMIEIKRNIFSFSGLWKECAEVLKAAFNKVFEIELKDGDGGIELYFDENVKKADIYLILKTA